MRGQTKKIFIVLLILSQGIVAPGKEKKDRLTEARTNFHINIFYMNKFRPDYGSSVNRAYFESIWDSFERGSKKGDENLSPHSKTKTSPRYIAVDKIENQESRKIQGNSSQIKMSLLYEIKDDFKSLNSIYKIGFYIYFSLGGVVQRNKRTYNGIFRINEENWYELITGTNFYFAADLGKNRIIGYCIDTPLKLYGFRQNFRDEFYIELPDFRFRQALYKLNDAKFIFHNFRLKPSDKAVEIYSISGRRLKEVFDYVPYNFKQNHTLPLAPQTVLTTNKKGCFYIAFQYPLNPYRVWKFDENGAKVKVFGNYFDSPEVYNSPDEWIMMSYKDIKHYGLRQIYSINQLLTDSDGRLFVFFSKNKIKKKLRGKDIQKYFMDIYTKDGDFIGRTEFKYGFPELIDNNIIYSRTADDTSPSTLKITAVKLNIE